MSIKTIKVYVDTNFIEQKLPEDYKNNYDVILIDSDTDINSQTVELSYILVPKEFDAENKIQDLQNKMRFHIDSELKEEDF